MGAIFAGGPRHLDVNQARSVLGLRRPTIKRVGVFGDQDDHAIITMAVALDLDIIQLHNDPTAQQVRRLQQLVDREIWPVVRMDGAAIPTAAAALGALAGTVVLDAKAVGQLGGTGLALDWHGMRESVIALRAAVPGIVIVLAGGLRPTNVANAVGLLQPDVVDVSSGVESNVGIKDRDAVKQFVQAIATARGTGDGST